MKADRQIPLLQLRCSFLTRGFCFFPGHERQRARGPFFFKVPELWLQYPRSRHQAHLSFGLSQLWAGGLGRRRQKDMMPLQVGALAKSCTHAGACNRTRVSSSDGGFARMDLCLRAVGLGNPSKLESKPQAHSSHWQSSSMLLETEISYWHAREASSAAEEGNSWRQRSHQPGVV